jgi:ATP-dependent Clp protease ATP-binding subunit ClpA
VLRAVKESLTPEFRNRVDEIIVFDPLSEKDLLAIARLMIAQVNETLAEKGIELCADDKIYQWLVDTSCSERSLWARPLRRAIQRYCEDSLAERVIEGRLDVRGRIEVFLGEDGKPEFRNKSQIAPANA